MFEMAFCVELKVSVLIYLCRAQSIHSFLAIHGLFCSLTRACTPNPHPEHGWLNLRQRFSVISRIRILYLRFV